MADALAQLDSKLSGLLAQLGPAQRRALARQIVTRLRASQQQRIRLQQNPDGSGFEARRPQLRKKKGAIRRQMFAKLRLARFLKTQSSPAGGAVEFIGQVQRIARVHQLGLRDRVSRQRGVMAQYPARELLGFSNADIDSIQDQVIAHLATPV
ncbi:phage virion morphogenesis protein [Chromobacterium haemolyticum]|uniref:phage virion morphogenesis protein n=1 Tax=Chromobacterium haemolyticum TaxID=394935 RepID=UPI001745E428|nr:phage virion morphogenesis protein [Chromobacterium haemolyticum]QOD81619.1 phage virion morphogenesis protein [Chromobacterium haemolyticum]